MTTQFGREIEYSASNAERVSGENNQKICNTYRSQERHSFVSQSELSIIREYINSMPEFKLSEDVIEPDPVAESMQMREIDAANVLPPKMAEWFTSNLR